MPLLKKKFVDDLGWIKEKDALDVAAIAMSSPGAVAVNASLLLGYRMAGVMGAAVTIAGTVLPPLLIITVISIFYNAFSNNPFVNAALIGMRAGVAAVIADVVMKMGGRIIKEKGIPSIAVMVGAFVAASFLKINVIFIIIICGTLGAVRGFRG